MQANWLSQKIRSNIILSMVPYGLSYSEFFPLEVILIINICVYF